MRLREQAGTQADAPVLQDPFKIKCADELFLARAQRQVHEVAFGQERSQRPSAGGLGGAARAFDEHATDERVDGGEQ